MGAVLGQTEGGPCPCGTGEAYAACCGPLHRQERLAETAEELMRSRYSAYARGEFDHVFRTWHPRTRPADVTADAHLVWQGLEVLGTSAGGPDDDTGEVEFRASYQLGKQRGTMRERSRFTRRGARWVYLDGHEITD
ncbi:YchJ family protein [Ornithinimicrobium cryptoxanthini]|uniref:YchJ family protein n=1 Tax=Ornithinimicrobium cryptoxanthini TaxID=2934161 RepID=UPI002117686C|nr:YchJ family metal-binding protein [Ornithinimicrobium cryptoxanthini]